MKNQVWDKILRGDVSAVFNGKTPNRPIESLPAGTSSFAILYGTIYSDTKLHNR